MRQGWLMKGLLRGWEPPLPNPLLHKCVEEREETLEFRPRNAPVTEEER
jgi:hypothetical protein